MLISVLISRAVLSITMIVFLMVAIGHKNMVTQVIASFQKPLFVAFSFLFFIPFFSGLWSSDLHKWSDVVKMKLPFLLFPIAFGGRWRLSVKQWGIVTACFLLVVLLGCVWSISYYLLNISVVHESYLRAKTIPTPLEDDHVRFSWLVSVASLVCFYCIQLKPSKKIRGILIGLALFFVAYLHILSARTGILSFYIFLCLYAIFILYKKLNYKRVFLTILIIVLLPLAAYFSLPTLQARVKYVLYDISLVQKKQYVQGSNDGARVRSMQAGWQVLMQNPLGVGAGDIMHEADKWYNTHVPEIIPTDKFPPLSEWLLYGGFAGWPGVIGFTLIMLMPLLVKLNRDRFFWVAFHIIAAFSFVFDMGLEVQYGVFIYAFTFFCLWKWLTQHAYDQ